MTRVLLAWVPTRTTFWSGLSGGCVTYWNIDGTPTSALSLRTRVRLDEDVWLPGDPSERPIEMPPRVPTWQDGIPIKDNADVFVAPAPGLRGRTIALQIGSSRVDDALAPNPPSWKEPAFRHDCVAVKLERDAESFQLAPFHKRAELFEAKASLGWDVDGLQGPAGTLGFGVGAFVQFKEQDPILVEMLCDAVYVDLNRGEWELVWRGIFFDNHWGADIERILIGILPPDLEEDARIERLEEGLPLAVFSWSATSDDIEKELAPPRLRDEDLAIARLSTWENGPGACLLSQDEYSQISSELAARPRGEVLGAHGFDEIGWSREEWAQSERIANESASLPDDLGDDDKNADIQVKPVRPAFTPKKIEIAEYARLSAHLELRDPARVLSESKLSVNEFLVIEETMTTLIDGDEALAAAFDTQLATYRAEARSAHEADLERLGVDVQDEPSPSATETKE